MTLPPGPCLPAALQTAALVRDPLRHLERCMRRYGDVFTGRYLGIGDAVWVADPAAVRDILTAGPERFQAGPNGVLQFLVGRDSVFTVEGERHARKRRFLVPPFHGDAVRRYGALFRAISEREVAAWPLGREFALRPRMQALTLESIMRAVFGIDEEPRLARLRRLVPPLLDLVGNLIWIPPLQRDLGRWSPWARLLRLRAALARTLDDEIARRRASADLPQRTDILSLLIQARDEDGRAMPDAELRDEVTTLLFAGHETTATALAWTLDLLLHHPAALARVRAEVAAGDESYLDAVVKEALRLRPVVLNVVRFARQPATIAGHRVPAGTRVLPAIALIQRRPDLFEDPQRFRPERFLERRFDAYAWLPFGAGGRRCIGTAFALLEMRVVLRTIVERVRLRAAAALERPRWRIVTMAPARGVRVVVDAGA